MAKYNKEKYYYFMLKSNFFDSDVIRYLQQKQNGYEINSKSIKEVVESTFLGKSLLEDTFVGMTDGMFNNKGEFEEILPEKVLTVDKFFNNLISGVKEYYGV